jgi:hypothetical protein
MPELLYNLGELNCRISFAYFCVICIARQKLFWGMGVARECGLGRVELVLMSSYRAQLERLQAT